MLLVEDDEDDFVLTSSLLSEIGAEKFALDWVTTYDSAMDKITQNDHDVCLLDYRLGVHTGLEFLRDALCSGYDGPIILLTGQGDQEIDVEAMKAGASDYLIKGQINADVLERSIRYSLEQKRIEKERVQHIREQEARAQAEAANQAKDEFLAMVSHELRTPLNTMLGWTQVLRKGKSDEKTLTRAVDAIERSARQQAKFVEDLLDVTRIVNGNLRLEMQTVNLASVIEQVVDECAPTADAKSIKLEATLAETDITVSGDPDRLRQVINNLLSNAVKFTPAGGRIEIKLERENANAKITVSDNGKGINPDFLPYVFDRYRQADDTKTERTDGLGLGLAIASSLVEMHGGTISAESGGEGQGATFTVILPLLSLKDI